MKNLLFADELWLPWSRDEVFPFFSEARNLEAITPPWLRFEVLTPGMIRLGTGVLIDYRLCVHGVPLRWQSEITEWEPEHRFVDQQRRGPYLYWRHEHTFTPSRGGTLCRDEVAYRVPGGSLVDRLFVRRDIERIFSYRRAAITDQMAKRAGRSAA